MVKTTKRKGGRWTGKEEERTEELEPAHGRNCTGQARSWLASLAAAGLPVKSRASARRKQPLQQPERGGDIDDDSAPQLS